MREDVGQRLPRMNALQRRSRNVQPQDAVAFELRFGEELVCRALVREGEETGSIFTDVLRLVTSQAGLEVE